jgi:hypothetical protein
MRQPRVSRRSFLGAAAAPLAASAVSPPAGFIPLFDSRSFDGWEIDTPSVWSIRDGIIIGSSPGLKYNEFLRTRKHFENFELHVKLRLLNGAGNTGVQFRSLPMPGSHEVIGYQADGGEKFWGALYDESRRRRILAGPPADFLTRFDPAAWHSYQIRATGPRIILTLDGVQTVDYSEPDPAINRSGFIALQVHSRPQPIEVWFRDIWLKPL